MAKKLCNVKDEFTAQLCGRLERVTIENSNALNVIAAYDAPDAFHFVDLPRVNSDCDHYKGIFSEQNMEQFLQLLETVKGKFMLTMFPFNMIDRYTNRSSTGSNARSALPKPADASKRSGWFATRRTVTRNLILNAVQTVFI
ncbi:MAG: hypothetical protein NC250_01180 [Alistipes senegalensis]|nr:hypothetical protein [Bacteroides cellulosilyticus]MCM1351331.1 hypothetical protein [Alistipes senegalensis]